MGNFETVRLGDVATYINGYAFKPSDWSDNGLPIIRIQNLTGNDYETNYYSGDYNKKYEVVNGDILISWSASLGVYEWKNEKALLNQHIFKVVFDKLPIDKSYFVHTVSYLLNDMLKETHGSTMKHITKPRFDNTAFPYPPLETQKQIADTLDKVTHTIDLCNAILEKLDLLVKSRFIEMFGEPISNPMGWEVRRLDEVAILNKGITYAPEDVSDEGIVVLRSSNIKGNTFNLEDIVKITKSVNTEKYVQKNDILMCNRNGSARLVGKVAKIPILSENMTFGTFMTIVRSDIYEYLFIFFQLEAFREQIKFQTAVAINQISLPLLASVKVPIPPKKLIGQFATFVEQTDKSKLAVKQVLEKAETLKKALMQEYFG